MIKKITLILLILLVKINAQQLNQSQLDSLYNLYTSLRGINESFQLQTQIEEDPSYRKCGMTLVQQIKSNLSYFSVEQQTVLSKLLQRRDDLPKTLNTLNGFFKIHYSDSGTDAIGYDVNLLAQALDSAYSFEINYLGYPPPPTDGFAGGDGRYDVYVVNLRSYGETDFENEISPNSNTYTSYMIIDNDFNEVSTKGINGARVTVAHEFHHAIQVGNYIWRSEDAYFYELTSTAFEDFVFDTVNDYIYYIKHYFNNTSKPFSANKTELGDGYDLGVWNIYLKNVFGFDIIKRQWELMKTIRAMAAISTTIFENGSSFGNELNRFGIWTYYTSYRSIPGKYFKDASKYPLVRPMYKSFFNPPSSRLFSIGTSPASNYFLDVKDSTSNDSLTIILTNSDVQNAIDNQYQIFNASYNLFSDVSAGDRKLGNYYSASLIADQPTFWMASEIINGAVVNGDSTSIISSNSNFNYSFPSPFYYKNNYSFGSFISFPVKASLSENVQLYIYNISMNLVYAGNEKIRYLPNNSTGIVWDALNEYGEKLATGVYVYVIKYGDDIIKGKLVIFND